ncbi:hypothetical protein C8R47DRAFT_1230580 [Mycena vitilis]|nr:hypothetical protein C8R47DRAFT_1230580 [Mycena vitilis]
MDIASSFDIDLELAQINVLASVVKTIAKKPLRRILQMHRVDFLPSDGTAALRKHLRAYLKRLRLGKKNNDSLHLKRHKREQELSALRSDWPTLVPASRKKSLVEAFQRAISSDTLAMFACGSCSGVYSLLDQKRLKVNDIDLRLLRRPDFVEVDPSDSNSEKSDEDVDVDMDTASVEADADMMSVDVDESMSGNVNMEDVSGDLGLSFPSAVEGEIIEHGSSCEDRPEPVLPWLYPNCSSPPMPSDELTVIEEAMIARCR